MIDRGKLGQWAFSGTYGGDSGNAIARFAKKVGRRMWRKSGSLPGVPTIWNSPVGAMVVTFNHDLPNTLAVHPLYSQNLPRLAEYVLTKYSDLTLIDVGANIGDTARFLRAQLDIPILCVEGSQEYLPYLLENTAGMSDVEIETSFLGEAAPAAGLELVSHKGTARLSAEASAESPAEVSLRTLDDVLTSHPRFAGCKLLKTDTDGFDAKVLRGATKLLEGAKPLVFTEYDPIFLSEQGDSGLGMLSDLRSLGYAHALVYDAYGYLVMGLSLDDWELIEQLDEYVTPRVPLPYFDLALFHSEDADLFELCMKREKEFFRASRRDGDLR